ncbi:MAG: hypothetical protein H6Q20_1378 [Bacteroidetes bacterium]|nr:hypothetical protein [Bacteroidota bacterium]
MLAKNSTQYQAYSLSYCQRCIKIQSQGVLLD